MIFDHDLDLADARVTANLYCSGRLDEVLLELVPGLLAALREIEPRAFVWTIRYSLRGEHLKLRAHLGEGAAPMARERLREHAERFLAGRAPAAANERVSRAQAAPIDAEDRSTDEQPDCSLLFTTYSPSFITLGSDPFLSDPVYRLRACRCLAAGCERALLRLGPSGNGVTLGQRLRLVIEAVLDALRAIGWSDERVISCLTYQRDWVVRYPILKARQDESRIAQSLQRLDEQCAGLGGLAQSIGESWRLGDSDAETSDAWRRAVVELVNHTSTFAGDPAHRVDPFAEDVSFPLLFKVLHGVANQAGLFQLREGIVYHLLLQALAGDAAPRAISLVPP